MLPPLPLTATPLDLPLVVQTGDHGAAIVARLVGGDGGYVQIPVGSTVLFAAVERRPVPERERRAPRSFSGGSTISSTDASLVSYVLLASDTCQAGTFDISFKAIYPTLEVLTFRGGPLDIVGETMGQAVPGGSSLLYVIPADATGKVTATASATQFTSVSRIYSGGVVVKNTEPSGGNSVRIGGSNIDGGATHPGFLLAPGESLPLSAIDVSTLYALAPTGSPEVDWFGVDLA